MALIQKIKELELLIPDRESVTGVKCVSDDIILCNPIFAIVVNGHRNTFSNAYKAIFFVRKIGHKYQLFLTNFGKDFKTAVDYVYVGEKDAWPFKEDNIGIYLESESKTGNKIYFGTELSDIGKIRKAMANKSPARRTVYLSTTYI